MKRPAIIAFAAACFIIVGILDRPSAEDRTYSSADLAGTWAGKMMNVKQSVKGIDVRMNFTPNQESAVKGTATFHNLDIDNRATGTIAKIEVAKDIVTFPLVYRSGAPGVDGTTGHYKLRFVTPDVLEGESENYESRASLRLRLERQKN